MGLWEKNGRIVTDDNGIIIDCDTDPCLETLCDCPNQPSSASADFDYVNTEINCSGNTAPNQTVPLTKTDPALCDYTGSTGEFQCVGTTPPTTANYFPQISCINGVWTAKIDLYSVNLGPIVNTFIFTSPTFLGTYSPGTVNGDQNPADSISNFIVS